MISRYINTYNPRQFVEEDHHTEKPYRTGTIGKGSVGKFTFDPHTFIRPAVQQENFKAYRSNGKLLILFSL
jgi:hypothetical protein